MLKFMVIIVIALAKRKQCHKKRVARTASHRIRLGPDGMAGRVNQECAMLEHDNFCHATNEKTSQRADPAVPHEPGQCRENEADHHRDKMNISMLPHDQWIFL